MAVEQGIQLDWTKPGGQEQRGPLEAIARPYSRISALDDKGVSGVFAAPSYAKGVQKFLSGYKLQVHFLDSTPTPALIQLY